MVDQLRDQFECCMACASFQEFRPDVNLLQETLELTKLPVIGQSKKRGALMQRMW